MSLCLDAEIVGPWVYAAIGSEWIPRRGSAIGKLDGAGDLCAGVVYEDFNGANIVCHIAGRGLWATKGLLKVLFDYPFVQLGVNRITVQVRDDNKKSIELVKRMGFELECTLYKATPVGDLYIYRMFKENCKYIRG